MTDHDLKESRVRSRHPSPLLASTVLLAGLLAPAPALAGSAPAAQAAPATEAVAYGTGSEVRVSGPPGTPPRTVLTGATDPDVFPDGSRLVSQQTYGRKLYVSTIDVTGSRRLTRETSGEFESAPNVSSDGQRVVYEQAVEDDQGVHTPQLMIAEVDTGRATALGVSGFAPLWSPDGRFVAFRPLDRFDAVDVVDATGAGQVRLTSAGRATDWSPDGRTLALATGYTSGQGVRTLALGDRSARSVLTSSSAAGVSRSYGPSALSASGTQLYVQTVDQGPGKGDVDQRLRRYALSDGSEDTGFPAPQWFGPPSDCGGVRAQPASTSPSPVTGLSVTVSPSSLQLRYARQTAPDTAGVTVRYAVGTTPPASVTDGMAGPDSLASTATIDRLAPGTTYSVSVFTRDWSGAASGPATATVTTPAQVATSLALSGPGRITYGDGSTLTGRLTRQDTGAGIAGARVVLVGHHEGDPENVLQTLTTDSDGRFSTRRLTSEATRYGVRFAGDGPLLASTGSTLVLVRPRLSISISPSSRVAAYSRAVVSVTISPAFPGGNVRIEQRLYGTARNVLTRFDRSSRAGITLDTSRRQADGTDAIKVTPGYRRGYVADPAYADFVIS